MMDIAPAKAMAAAAALATTALTLTPLAGAEDAPAAPTHWLGTQAEISNGTKGEIVQGWTVSHLQPSSDALGYTPIGQLWEATATDKALHGTVTPIVSNFNARAANGETYRVLFGVPTPQGVNPATLSEGGSTTGKLYWDVTGAPPDSVFYAEGSAPPRVVWLTPPAQEAAVPSAATPLLPAEMVSAPDEIDATALSEASEGTPLVPLTPAAPAAATEATPVVPAQSGAEDTAEAQPGAESSVDNQMRQGEAASEGPQG